jgi:hypothetical protein
VNEARIPGAGREGYKNLSGPALRQERCEHAVRRWVSARLVMTPYGLVKQIVAGTYRREIGALE